MYVAFHMPMFGTANVDSKPMECPTCPRGISLGANDWQERDVSTCKAGDRFTCNRCGTSVEVMWGLDEPDHLSTWMNAEYCPHRLCQIKFAQLSEKQGWIKEPRGYTEAEWQEIIAGNEIKCARWKAEQDAKKSAVKQEHGPLPAEAGRAQETGKGKAR